VRLCTSAVTHGDGARLTRNDQRLGHGKGIQQTEARAAHVKGTAALASAKFCVKLRGQRGIRMVRFAGGDNPIEFVRGTPGTRKRVLRGSRAQREFGLAFGGVRQRFDAGTFAKLADGHAEGAIYFFRRGRPRTEERRGTRDEREQPMRRGRLGIFRPGLRRSGLRCQQINHWQLLRGKTPWGRAAISCGRAGRSEIRKKRAFRKTKQPTRSIDARHCRANVCSAMQPRWSECLQMF
jgi:hypothetical protein